MPAPRPHPLQSHPPRPVQGPGTKQWLAMSQQVGGWDTWRGGQRAPVAQVGAADGGQGRLVQLVDQGYDGLNVLLAGVCEKVGPPRLTIHQRDGVSLRAENRVRKSSLPSMV